MSILGQTGNTWKGSLHHLKSVIVVCRHMFCMLEVEAKSGGFVGILHGVLAGECISRVKHTSST